MLVWWYNLFALGFLLYVHRTSAVVVYCVALANYFIAKTYGMCYCPSGASYALKTVDFYIVVLPLHPD